METWIPFRSKVFVENRSNLWRSDKAGLSVDNDCTSDSMLRTGGEQC